MVKKELLRSDYRIRKLIGVLGVLLPVILFLFHGELLSSISHYYYTKASIFFIIILSVFGLFLVSYKGYEIDKETENISDNVITNIAGVGALIAVFLPTSCAGSHSAIIIQICRIADYPLFGHCDTLTSTMHLIGAGIFMLAVGWMSYYKFPRGRKKNNNKLYRICGLIVWGAVILILILFVIIFFTKDVFYITKYDVFILETIAVVAFGTSWLVKGKTITHVIVIKNKILEKV